MPTGTPTHEPDTILRTCCAAWRVSEAEILGPRKPKPVAEARRVAAYFLRLYTGMEPGEIARKLRKSLGWTAWAFWSVVDQGETDKAFAAKCQGVELALRASKPERLQCA